MARYKSKAICKCGRPTIKHRNLCEFCWRDKNAENSRRARARRKQDRLIVDELPDFDKALGEPTVLPRFSGYRIDPIYLLTR